MSVLCDCPRCGGTDKFALCENALLSARVDIARSENRRVLLLSFGLFLFALCLFIGVHSVPELPFVDVQSLPLKQSVSTENTSGDPADNWEYLD